VGGDTAVGLGEVKERWGVLGRDERSARQVVLLHTITGVRSGRSSSAAGRDDRSTTGRGAFSGYQYDDSPGTR